jgi:glutamate-ammonia-ligase adenylyltransferase
VAVLRSSLSVSEIQQSLSALAEALLEAVLQLSLREMESRHGRLPGPQLCVIAYGSLGGVALGIDSDLDLIFLYEPSSKVSLGERAIHAERYHTGVARRMLSLLAATTPSGKLYSIDARLRPNGRSGLLVSSVDAFKRYQLNKAWVWELQALTRARPVAGNSDVASEFSEVRLLALTAERDPAIVRQEVRKMRSRISEEKQQGDPLKHKPGGLLDIEFVVQLGVLINARKHPDVISGTSVYEQLKLLHKCGWLDDQQFQTLDSSYTQLGIEKQEKALVDNRADQGASINFALAKTLCDEILR